MKKHFSIGDVSKIYGISVQALRLYHKMGLIIPKHIDELTGYRYYTFDQFQFISRLKFLQSLGLSLEEIKLVLSDGDAGKFKEMLNKIKEEKEKELDELNKKIQEIEWTISYYSYTDQNAFQGIVYMRNFDERHIIISDSNHGDSIEQMDVELHKLVHSERFKSLNYRRQYGYILDFDSLLQGSFTPLNATLFINKSPSFQSARFKVLPAGNYLCYCARILTDQLDIGPIKNYVMNNPNLKAEMVFAVEYEDNLKEYYNALYEIQVYISN